MPLFISAVLLAAVLQNCGKLSLLKRRFGFILAAVLAILPFILAEKAANTSLREFQQMMSDPATLNELCALVIIQEFANIILGFSLLGEKPETLPEKGFRKVAHYLKFPAFFPSILLFYSVWYGQMYLFNHFPGYSFSTLTWVTALIFSAGALLLMELMRLLRRNHTRRILTVMHLEYLLVVPAIFLPVAANAKLIPGNENFDFRQPALLLIFFSAAVIVCTVVFYILKQKKKGKFHVHCNPNP